MSDPVIKTCAKSTWTKIATNVNSCVIKKSSNATNYLIAIKLTGESVPTSGNNCFENSNIEVVENSDYIDVYIYAIEADGKITVIDSAAPSIGQVFSMSNDALLSTNYLDDYSVRGDVFNISKLLTVTATTTVKCVLDFSAVTADREIFLLPLTFASSGGYFKVKTYNVSAYASGSSVPFINFNENSLKTPLTVFKTAVTSSDSAGNDLREYIIGGGSNPASSRGGSGGASNQIWVKRGVKKIIEITNTTNANADILIAIVLIEARQKTN